MPKAWSTREKELVRKSLQAEGQKLFEKQGIQKTSVDDIVRAAGISKGAFYIFYRSKEELYFDIMEKLEKGFKEQLFGCLSRPGLTRKKSFELFLREMLVIFAETPILRQMSSADYTYLYRKLPEKAIKNHLASDLEQTSRVFGEWMKKGWMRKVDMAGLAGLIFSQYYFIMHKDDPMAFSFDAEKEIWIKMMVDYLIISDK
ncbi:MAG: TetR/AcrR family transcriptional regulator [Spirochaetes bacterium]|nr:TetR/AcrR family transcriptional regulator [Spirochaetota bacterium]